MVCLIIKFLGKKDMQILFLNQIVKAFLPIFFIVALVRPSVGQTQDIGMQEVRNLAKLPVDKILEGVPISPIDIDHYLKTIHKRNRPVIVFFYINKNSGSQRVATLIHFLVGPYKDRIDWYRFKVQGQGKPGRNLRSDLQKRYSLDDIPGILFYDNVNDEMVLEDEDYIDADFKEFRTPRMFFWKTYYSTVRKELDKLLAD